MRARSGTRIPLTLSVAALLVGCFWRGESLGDASPHVFPNSRANSDGSPDLDALAGSDSITDRACDPVPDPRADGLERGRSHPARRVQGHVDDVGLSVSPVHVAAVRSRSGMCWHLLHDQRRVLVPSLPR